MTDRIVQQDRGPHTSSTLLVRIQAREPDPDAWRRFVDLYHPLVISWCQRFRLQPADVEDVTQEVFRSVLGAIGTFRRRQVGGSFRGWLKTITRNAVRDWGRGKARSVQGAGGDAAMAALFAIPEDVLPDIDERRDREEDRMLLREALRALIANVKPQTREAFWRVVVEGRSPAEVARELGVKEHVVYLAKSRILKRLRDEYGDLLDL